MEEIFVIYNKDTGLIEGGSGRINRDWDSKNKDGSTISERILQILVNNPNKEVIYLLDQNLPDSKKHKIVGGKIVDKTEAEKQLVVDVEANETKVQTKIRELAIESLKATGDLPEDYK